MGIGYVDSIIAYSQYTCGIMQKKSYQIYKYK